MKSFSKGIAHFLNAVKGHQRGRLQNLFSSVQKPDMKDIPMLDEFMKS